METFNIIFSEKLNNLFIHRLSNAVFNWFDGLDLTVQLHDGAELQLLIHAFPRSMFSFQTV